MITAHLVELCIIPPMIGIDIVKIDRIEKMLQKFEKKALERFLCAEEIALVKSASTAAGFWALKEAASKALGCGIGKELSFNDIKIVKDSKGAPKIQFRYHIIERFQILKTSASITHDGGFAVGVVVIETKELENAEGF